MYKYIYIIGIFILSSSCSNWLDVQPKGRVGEDALFENEQGFKDALIGVYTEMAQKPLYAKELSMGTLSVFAGNYDIAVNSHQYYQTSLYNYEDTFVKNTVNNFWTNSYKVIANINNLLEAIDEKRSVFSKNNYQLVKGEALALRAFLHFDLLRLYGPIPELGLEDLAIPYLTEFTMATEPRSTGTQIIKFCKADLAEAIKLLSVNKEVVRRAEDIFLSDTRQHMNYWAAKGLLSRIELYQGNKEAAYQHAKEIIDAEVFPFVTSSGVSSSISPDRLFVNEHIFSLYIANMEDINAELFKESAESSLLTHNDGFISNLFEVASGGSTDYRYLFLWKTEGSSSVKYPAKFWIEDQGSGSKTSTKVVPLIRLSEIYYIAAESASSDLEKLFLLNEVRKHRGLQELPENLLPEEIEDEVFKAYKKEFYQEGQLFFYYKRKNIERIDGQSTPADAKVYIIPRPDDEVELNP